MSRATLDTQLNVFADFRPKIPAAFRGSPYVLLGNIHPRLQVDVLGQVDRPKLVAADTMNFWISGEPKALGEMLKKIDLLIINDEEARELSGQHNIARAAADILKRGPKQLIIKRGDCGAMLFDTQGAFFVPGYPLEEVLDPTGAGESFAGGLIGYLAMNDDVSRSHDASRDVLRSGDGVVLRRGDRDDEGRGPQGADLTRRIEQFRALVDYGGKLDFSGEQ